MAEDNPQPSLWAMPLIEEMRAFIREGREDRRQAAEDRKQAVEDRKQAIEDRKQAIEDRKQAIEDRKQAIEDRRHWEERWESDRRQAAEDRKEIARILEAIGKVGLRILKNQEIQTRLLETNNLLLRRALTNGRFHGNGGRGNRSSRNRG